MTPREGVEPVAWGVRRGSDGAIVSALMSHANAIRGAEEIAGVDLEDAYTAVPLYAHPTPAASEGVERPEIICLCGSTRFIETFQSEYGRLTDEGKIVLTVGRVVPQSEQALGSTRKVALDALHLRKIDLADRVLVLNVGGYVGPSTRREIAYATEHGKPIDLLYPDAGLDGPPPHPAATAREEAWKAMVEALAECLSWMRCDCGHPACKRCPATKEGDAALALARSAGGA